MTVSEIRELLQLATVLNAELMLKYSGRVFVRMMEAEKDERMGQIAVEYYVDFVTDADPDGEGWEHFSVQHGRSLKEPRLILPDGDEITIEQARALALTVA